MQQSKFKMSKFFEFAVYFRARMVEPFPQNESTHLNARINLATLVQLVPFANAITMVMGTNEMK